MRKQFKDTLLSLAQHDEKVVAILGDISVFLFNEFQKKYPERFFNMGICESTLISVAAGMGSQGFHCFVHSIAPFVTERCYEQIKLDMCYNHSGGNIVSCGASFDYAWDGATHHCLTDLAILRLLPNMEVIQPGSRKELDILIRSQYANKQTTYYRLSDYSHEMDLSVSFGQGVVIKDVGAKTTVMTAGPILRNVVEACKDIEVNLVYFHTIKPIDRGLIQKFSQTRILVIHDAYGLHEAISEVPNLQTAYYGLCDDFSPCYGKVEDIRRALGLDSVSIRDYVNSRIE